MTFGRTCVTAMSFLVAIVLCTAFVLPSSQASAGTYKKPACSSGKSLQKQSGQNKWRCKKLAGFTRSYRSKGTTRRSGQCKSILGVGYHWAKRGGKWKCCGTSPLGETCKNFTTNVGSCPAHYAKKNTGDGNKVCYRGIPRYSYSTPIWVD